MMTADLHYLAYSAVLTWIMLMAASLIRVKGWTPQGFLLGVSNRDNLPEASPIAARADRAAKNMLENMVLFAVVVLVARLGGVPAENVAPGAAIFFWARVVYFFVYLAGIPFLRTAVYFAGMVGLVMIMLASH
jgi:uncharacterized MAPEG superfamily protein